MDCLTESIKGTEIIASCGGIILIIALVFHMLFGSKQIGLSHYAVIIFGALLLFAVGNGRVISAKFTHDNSDIDIQLTQALQQIDRLQDEKSILQQYLANVEATTNVVTTAENDSHVLFSMDALPIDLQELVKEHIESTQLNKLNIQNNTTPEPASGG